MSKELKKYLDKTTDNIAHSLQGAALEYFNLGIGLYTEEKQHPLDGSQTVLGNLSIACELLLKTIVARKMFSCLYPDLSNEALAVLHYPDSMPAETMPNVFVDDLRNFTKDTIKIDRAISHFYQLYPKKKQEFNRDLSLLAKIRNIAVHAAVPEFQSYQLERVAYITCKLFKFAKDNDIFKERFTIYNMSKIDKIINKYNENLMNKFHKSMGTAQEKSKSLKSIVPLKSDFNKWEARVETCPVCKNDALCYGYFEEHEGSLLLFSKEQFKCDNCELTLDNVSELNLARIEPVENYPEDIDEWSQHKGDRKLIWQTLLGEILKPPSQ